MSRILPIFVDSLINFWDYSEVGGPKQPFFNFLKRSLLFFMFESIFCNISKKKILEKKKRKNTQDLEV